MDWQERLESAFTPPDIAAVARDFLAQFDASELGGLPESCRPPERMEDVNDIAAYAYELARHRSQSDCAHEGLIDQLSHFFSNASNRLARVTARHGSKSRASQSL